MKKIILALFIVLGIVSFSFSAVSNEELSEKKQVQLIVLLWKDVQTYVDMNEFTYWYTNDHHVEYIIEKILNPYGIFDHNDYWVGVLGSLDGRPVAVKVIVNFTDNTYERYFEIKNVIEEKCDDPDNCA